MKKTVTLYQHYYFHKGGRNHIESSGPTMLDKDTFLNQLQGGNNRTATLRDTVDFIKTVVLCSVEIDDSFEVKE